MSERISHPIFKSISKYQNHPNIFALRRVNLESSFYFRPVTINDLFKEITKLNSRKATQTMDIPIKILKENSELLSKIAA